MTAKRFTMRDPAGASPRLLATTGPSPATVTVTYTITQTITKTVAAPAAVNVPLHDPPVSAPGAPTRNILAALQAFAANVGADQTPHVDAHDNGVGARGMAVEALAQGLRARGKGARRSVLAVDDDPFQRVLIAQYLSGIDVDLTCAATGREALDCLWNRRPDLILMDVDLPDYNGVDLMRRIKSIPTLAPIPVVMLTGHHQREVVLASLTAGAADYVAKPYTFHVLRDKLLALVPGCALQYADSRNTGPHSR